jgi:F-type H+-transporting ATPase subunit c
MRRVILFAAATVAVLGSFGLASAAEVAAVVDTTSRAYIALAAGLAIGIGALGAALGQGRMAAAAMESIGRNPNAADRIQLPMILGLAFIEALALYAFVIAFFLQGKI